MSPKRSSEPGIDPLDRRILKALNENARKSFRDLSRELGLSLTTVSKRIRRMEEVGIIQGYVPVLDASKLGFDLHVIVGVKIAHGRLIEVQQKISRNPHVFAVYDVTGEWDSVLIARFRDRGELDSFIKELLSTPHVERTETQLVLNTMKEERRVVL